MAESVSYRPGEGVALVAPPVVLLLAPSGALDVGALQQLWRACEEEPSLRRVAAALASFGLERLPALAALELADDAVHLLVRGAARAVVTGAGEEESITGDGLVTWVERRIPVPVAVVLEVAGRDPAAAGGQFARPLLGGIVDAASVQVHAAAAPLGAAPAASAAPTAAEGAGAVVADTGGRPPASELERTVPANAAVAGTPAPLPPPAAAPVVHPAGEPPARRTTDPASTLDYRTAVAEQPDDGADDATAASSAGAGGEWAEGLPPRDTHHGAPTVPAVLCPAGHPNPPHAGICRICREPVAAAEAVPMARPVLGRLRFSSGLVVPLDRPALVGRAPDQDSTAGATAGDVDAAAGDSAPRLVAVPSPDHEVSRRHLEVRLDGWHVLLVDLGSTNGTTVAPPGQPAERLRPGEEYPILPGTVVSVADEVSFVYEAG